MKFIFCNNNDNAGAIMSALGVQLYTIKRYIKCIIHSFVFVVILEIYLVFSLS